MESSVAEDISKNRSLEGFEQTCKSPARDSKSGETVCAYCGEPVGTDVKLTIEDLNTSCHPSCFKCGICGKPMGDLLDNMFLRQGTVHCDSCYTNVI